MMKRNIVTLFKRSFSVQGRVQQQTFVPNHTAVDSKDIKVLSEFINSKQKLFVLTGAGISTESGIRDYRSEGVGLYATSSSRPIQYIDFLKKPEKRHRYWARSYEGWPSFSSYQPNICHKIIADMEHYGNLHWLVTQNVDSLHRKSGSEKITELHGTQFRVGCLSCEYEVCRHELQAELDNINPNWSHSKLIKQGPDGDVIIDESVADTFNMIDCPSCGGILKPKVVFFGDNVPGTVKNFLMEKLKESDGLLIVGSSLQVYSSFRFIIAANDNKIPILILNIGETRGDRFAQIKISARAGDILPKLKLNWSNEILLRHDEY